MTQLQCGDTETAKLLDRDREDHPVRPRAVLAVLVFPLGLLLASGCSRSEPPAAPRISAPPVKPVKKTALQAKGLDGVLTGKIVYDGEPPAAEFIERIKDNEDKEACLKGGPAATHKQTWMVHRQTKGVANVVVWLEPPPGKYFSLRDRDKDLRRRSRPH